MWKMPFFLDYILKIEKWTVLYMNLLILYKSMDNFAVYYDHKEDIFELLYISDFF